MADTVLERAAFAHSLQQAAQLVAARINAIAADIGGPLAAAMVYAMVGGKGLRAFFVAETARLHGVTYRGSQAVATAIECIHAYSLVHDDLPCMDDDDLRRGQPTVHRKWDEATAVLVGDALQALAFEEVARFQGSLTARLTLSQTLAIASGAHGMVGGQALDIAAETAKRPLTLDEITTLQAGKTGALITWSCMAGARMVDAETAAFQVYGDAVGLAFQITDDVLDATGDAATVGKAVGKDQPAGKATFVSLLGLDGAKRRAHDLVAEACDALSVYGDDAQTLRDAAQFVITRKY